MTHYEGVISSLVKEGNRIIYLFLVSIDPNDGSKTNRVLAHSSVNTFESDLEVGDVLSYTLYEYKERMAAKVIAKTGEDMRVKNALTSLKSLPKLKSMSLETFIARMLTTSFKMETLYEIDDYGRRAGIQFVAQATNGTEILHT